jgi:hypothetical protein
MLLQARNSQQPVQQASPTQPPSSVSSTHSQLQLQAPLLAPAQTQTLAPVQLQDLVQNQVQVPGHSQLLNFIPVEGKSRHEVGKIEAMDVENAPVLSPQQAPSFSTVNSAGPVVTLSQPSYMSNGTPSNVGESGGVFERPTEPVTGLLDQSLSQQSVLSPLQVTASSQQATSQLRQAQQALLAQKAELAQKEGQLQLESTQKERLLQRVQAKQAKLAQLLQQVQQSQLPQQVQPIHSVQQTQPVPQSPQVPQASVQLEQPVQIQQVPVQQSPVVQQEQRQEAPQQAQLVQRVQDGQAEQAQARLTRDSLLIQQQVLQAQQLLQGQQTSLDQHVAEGYQTSQASQTPQFSQVPQVMQVPLVAQVPKLTQVDQVSQAPPTQEPPKLQQAPQEGQTGVTLEKGPEESPKGRSILFQQLQQPSSTPSSLLVQLQKQKQADELSLPSQDLWLDRAARRAALERYLPCSALDGPVEVPLPTYLAAMDLVSTLDYFMAQPLFFPSSYRHPGYREEGRYTPSSFSEEMTEGTSLLQRERGAVYPKETPSVLPEMTVGSTETLKGPEGHTKVAVRDGDLLRVAEQAIEQANAFLHGSAQQQVQSPQQVPVQMQVPQEQKVTTKEATQTIQNKGSTELKAEQFLAQLKMQADESLKEEEIPASQSKQTAPVQKSREPSPPSHRSSTSSHGRERERDRERESRTSSKRSRYEEEPLHSYQEKRRRYLDKLAMSAIPHVMARYPPRLHPGPYVDPPSPPYFPSPFLYDREVFPPPLFRGEPHRSQRPGQW